MDKDVGVAQDDDSHRRRAEVPVSHSFGADLLANRAQVESLDARAAELREASAAAGRPVTCAARCWTCCCHAVDCGTMDAVQIAMVLRDAGRDAPSLRHRLAAAGRQQERMSPDKYFSRQRPCIFLGDDRLCTVYPVRPVACRLHCSVTEPSLCRTLGGEGISFKALLDEHSASCDDFARRTKWPSGGSLPAMALLALRVLERGP